MEWLLAIPVLFCVVVLVAAPTLFIRYWTSETPVPFGGIIRDGAAVWKALIYAAWLRLTGRYRTW